MAAGYPATEEKGGLAGDGSAGLEVSEGLAAEIWQGEMAKYAHGRQVAVLQVAASPFWMQNNLFASIKTSTDLGHCLITVL